jgi:hypothetical protein
MNIYGCEGHYEYLDLDGNPVKRSRESHPYNYDEYVIWQKDYKKASANVVYSDRLLQWDYDKFNECCMKVWGNEGQYFSNRESDDIEKFLSLYFGKNINLTAITQGCNVSNGYPYWVFFYENKE